MRPIDGNYILDVGSPMCESDSVAMGEPAAAGAPDEIEVTSAMIEAGAGILYAYETETAGEEYWAERVYRAMSLARKN